MSEFLKNNPIALRHCLLYLFLQKKSFYEFCKTVGNDVIERKEFQFWFKKFEQGKFNDKEQPIPDIREIIRRDKQAQRVCVLYEWLVTKKELAELMKRWSYQNKALPIFKKYQGYCKVLGDDVMKFSEFEFWFYRFANGEYDLNYELDKDKKIYELTDLPLDIMKNILDYLRIFNRMTLAKTSRSLKEFVESQKSSFKKLDFSTNQQTAEVCFEYRSIVIEKRAYGFYRKPECTRMIKRIDLFGFPYCIKLIGGVPYWKRGVQELESILKFPNLHLEVFRFQHPCGFDAVNALEALFKSIPQLHAKKLSLKSFSMKSLLNILPNLKPGYLTTIDFDVIDSKPCDLEELVKMEQWKQAKYLFTNESLFYGLLPHLCHFKELTVCSNKFSVEKYLQIKEILIKSPGIEVCTVRLSFGFHADNDVYEFGNAIEEDPDTYHFSIPNSNEYFEIELDLFGIVITRKNKYLKSFLYIKRPWTPSVFPGLRPDVRRMRRKRKFTSKT